VNADKKDLFNGIDCGGNDNGIAGAGCDVQPSDYSASITTTTYVFSASSKIVQRTENVTLNFDLFTTSFASGNVDDSPGGSGEFAISLGYKQYVGNVAVSVNSVNLMDLP
jgi:hypothetical protein